MTKEEMWALTEKHIEYELAQDVDGSLATMTSTPFYEFHPLGYRLEGAAAISAMYQRLWPAIYPNVMPREALPAGSPDPNRWINQDAVVLRDVNRMRLPSGAVVELSAMAIFEFEGGLIAGEVIYCDEPLSELTKAALGDDFLDLPGVRRLY